MRGRSPEILLVDGGDCFFSTPTKKAPSRTEEVVSLRKGRTILEAYNYMGYRAMGLGAADLQFGVDTLKKLLKDARFPVVCANLVEKESGNPVFSGSAVVKVGGVRFGVYGVLLSSLNASYKQRVLGDKYEILDAIQTTRKVVPELRKKSDVVLALSHINIDDNVRITRQVKGIDVIIDPYSRSGNQAVWITEGEYVVRSNGVPMLRIDGQGSRVGVFEMFFEQDGRNFTDYKGYDYPLDPQIFSHPEMETLVRDVPKGRWKGLPADFDPQGLRLIPDSFLGEEACGACHTKQQEFWKGSVHKDAYESVRQTNDHLRSGCVECHTLAYGVAFAEPKKVGRFKGVQCESCHGINPNHPVNPKIHQLGAVKDTTCWGCHNPQFTKKFDWDVAQAWLKTACPKMES